MITKDNLRGLLTCLGFQATDSIQDEMYIHFEKSNCSITVDFTNGKILYPEGIEADRDTTKNFSANENFVVLECVVGLLAQGYNPENLVLEPKTPGGREDSHFYCDILIRDNDKRPYMLIECKTMDGKEDDEFNKAWKKTLQDGGQLFNYYNTYRQAQYLALYASDIVEGEPRCNYRLITMTDNKDYLESNPKLLSFEKVAHDNGTRDDFFRVWKETYGQDYATNGAFEVDEVPAFGVKKKKMTIDDLIIVDNQDIQKKFHQFAQTLRQYNVASHENAFDKLVNLFLVKVVDEVRNPKDLQFLWKGAAYDDYYSFQDRLQRLYQIGMKDYLGEDVTYIDNASIENAFRMQRNDPDAIKDTILEYFRQLKFYSNSDFGFLDVHNKQLFVQNAVILKAMVEMLQDMRLKTEQQNQFLGDLFEQFLDEGVKQNEGQFFTPTPITRFMVSSLPLEFIISNNTDIPKAIDYACGAGHFLNEYATQIKPFVIEQKGEQALPDYYKNIHGIEKEYRLSKVSKVSSFMYGQDGIQIVYGDALVPHKQIVDGEYKVLVANPPYSVAGFLATLSKEQRNSYSLFSDVDDKQIDTNDSIETFFIERAKQLLSSDGVASIVLPSSIISSVQSKLDISVRDILLKYFDFVAVAEFGSATFGKTNTTTVVLFLRRKKSEPELATHYNNRVNAWFSNNHGQDYRYDDTSAIERYTRHIGVPYEAYLTLLEGNPSDELFKNEIFAAYANQFSNDTEAKKIKDKYGKKKGTIEKEIIVEVGKKKVKKTKIKKEPVFFSQQDVDSMLRKYIVDSIIPIEKEKLYYFMLCESNPQPVIVVKSPSKDADIKKFLGYEWKKYIGIVYPKSPKGENNIKYISTPLFDVENLLNEGKINTLIRKNYLGEFVEIPEELSETVNAYQLEDMLVFNNTDFDKTIKTTPVLVYPKIECKDDIRKEKLSVIAPYVTKNIKLSNISVSDYISTDNMLQNRAGVALYNGTPNIDSITEYKKGDILVSNIRPYLKKIWMADRNGGCSKDVLVFRNSKPKEVSNEYLKCIMSTDTFFEYMMVGKKGVKMPRGDKKTIPLFEIPIPSPRTQQNISKECDIVDKACHKAEKDIIDAKAKLEAIFDSPSSSKDTISSLCISINPSKTELSNMNDDENISFVDMASLSNDGYITNMENRTYGSVKNGGYTFFANGDIIIAKITPCMENGKCALADGLTNSIGFGSSEYHVFRVDTNKIHREIVFAFLNRESIRKEAVNHFTGSSGHRRVPISFYENLEVPRFDNEDGIVVTILQLNDLIKESQKIISESTTKKHNIIKKYLSE